MFDECMVHLKRRFNWSMGDILYQPVWDSHFEEVTRNQQPLMESPPVTSLPVKLQAILAARTTLDAALFSLVKHRFEAQIAEHGPSFAEEVADFKALNEVYLAHLKATDSLEKWG
eukprot:m.241439 g.241439  ORF g.241439 m.241439 type:complete len:115 (+) comp54424_c0_seq4:2-346(+)